MKETNHEAESPNTLEVQDQDLFGPFDDPVLLWIVGSALGAAIQVSPGWTNLIRYCRGRSYEADVRTEGDSDGQVRSWLYVRITPDPTAQYNLESQMREARRETQERLRELNDLKAQIDATQQTLDQAVRDVDSASSQMKEATMAAYESWQLTLDEITDKLGPIQELYDSAQAKEHELSAAAKGKMSPPQCLRFDLSEFSGGHG